MDRWRRSERDAASSPQPPVSTPHLLRDVSNLKTPRACSKISNPNPSVASPSPLFFTASKKTPYSCSSSAIAPTSRSAFRRHAASVAASASCSKAARRLKALEIEQSRSARKAQVQHEKALESFSRSLMAWLNFLLQNPDACGCKAEPWRANHHSSSKGKRQSLDFDAEIEVLGKWRFPKRQRGEMNAGSDKHTSLMKPTTLAFLQKSLSELCSLEDMIDRMRAHMSWKSCNEVLLMLSQVCKNIDEGRLKMKPHCPLVTDLAVREKAVKVLLCYEPLWLRTGLHILFGGESLLLSNEVQDGQFLKVFTEKHFLTHVGIARAHAFNKLVGGVYRPGYYEALGNIILKRFLLLVIALDKAKCESALPTKYGIDSIDGGSPLLFIRQSHIKSSQQVIREFLKDSMHGEGDLLAHLVILGCKVNYQQPNLAEHEFKVKNIFEDLQDGVVLCRVVQLLKRDASILSKLACPSDTSKKNLQNCSTAMQYLKDSGVLLSDSDGVMITATDIANGDKELTCSMLWNVFVKLQAPLLVSRTLLLAEIAKISASDMETFKDNTLTEVDLLLNWIKAVCLTQTMKVDGFSSLVDGRALVYLIKFYFADNFLRICREKVSLESVDDCNENLIRRTNCPSTSLHGIAYVQSVITMLGNYPEVLHPCDIFDQEASIDERSVVILFVFLASQLLSLNHLRSCHNPVHMHSSVFGLLQLQNSLPSSLKRYGNCRHTLFGPHENEGLGAYKAEENVQKIKLIQLWWRALLQRKLYLQLKRAASFLQAFIHWNLAKKHISEYVQKIKLIQLWWRSLLQRKLYLQLKRDASFLQALIRWNLAKKHISDRSARVIQARFRGFAKKNFFLKMKVSVILLQAAARAWLAVKCGSDTKYDKLAWFTLQGNGIYDRYHKYKIERQRFYRIKNSVIVIQRFVRSRMKDRQNNMKFSTSLVDSLDIPAATALQSYYSGMVMRSGLEREWLAAVKIQEAWKGYLRNRCTSAVIKIQSQWRCSSSRKLYLCRVDAIKIIQYAFRSVLYKKAFQKKRFAAIEIQRFTKGHLLRNMLLKISCFAIKIQSHWRCWLIRKRYLYQVDAIKLIQTACRNAIYKKAFQQKLSAAVEIQRFIRGQLARNKLLGSSKLRPRLVCQRPHHDSCAYSIEMCIVVSSILKLQIWWRKVLFRRSRVHATITIQSFVRCYLVKFDVIKKKQSITFIQRSWRNILFSKLKRSSALVIQSCIRGWVVRCTISHSRCSIIIIQRWWRNILYLKTRKKYMLVIQAYLRGWITRRRETKKKHHILKIQSCWRGYLVRKHSIPRLLDLRNRMKLSAANAVDDARLINRLVIALSELLGYRSITDIRHTCATLDLATDLSEKCCVTLVAAGAIDILLKQIQLLNRGVPDQEVLKHVLSTLRNIARYKTLSLVLINTHRSMEIIFQELLRNKNEGFLISCQLLRRLCSTQQGLEAARKLQRHVRKLNNVVIELERRTKFLARNVHSSNLRDLTLRRLREAACLMSLIADD